MFGFLRGVCVYYSRRERGSTSNPLKTHKPMALSTGNWTKESSHSESLCFVTHSFSHLGLRWFHFLKSRQSIATLTILSRQRLYLVRVWTGSSPPHHAPHTPHHAPTMSAPSTDGLPQSVFVSDDAEVFDVPMACIRRPLPSDLDESKVRQFMEDIQGGQKLTPIEVLWVEHPPGSNYYFATGGCHRWEAHTRLKSETIPSRLIKTPPGAMSIFMGASSPFYNNKQQVEQQQQQQQQQQQGEQQQQQQL